MAKYSIEDERRWLRLAKKPREWLDAEAEAQVRFRAQNPVSIPKFRVSRSGIWTIASPHAPFLKLIRIKNPEDALEAGRFLRSLPSASKIWIVDHMAYCLVTVGIEASERSLRRRPRGIHAGRKNIGDLKNRITWIYLWLEHASLLGPRSHDTQVSKILRVALANLLGSLGVSPRGLDASDKLVCATAFLSMLSFGGEWKSLRLKDPFEKPFDPRPFYRTWIQPREAGLRDLIGGHPGHFDLKRNDFLRGILPPFVLD